MDNLNKNIHRFSKTIKVVIIAFLVLLLLIPMFMIEDLITDRGRTQVEAIDEVSQKWSWKQTIVGPYVNLQYPIISTDDKGKENTILGNLILFPDELLIDGDLKTEILKRGIYEVNVYQSELVFKGTFSAKELLKSVEDLNSLQFEKAAICINLTDMRGINEQVNIKVADSTYTFEPGMDGLGIKNMGLHAIVNLSALKENKELPYEMKIKLKGSQSIHFTPIGKTTKVNLKANWNTPSFTGNFLPQTRNITETDFSAQWVVLNLNRNFSQVMMNNIIIDDIDSSSFGVNLKVPVEQYQQSTRSAKYAILIILLTFTVIFFTEIMDKTRIHALQYLLVGLALCLFYSLLLSISEHTGFNTAYLISALLTISLVGVYMFGIIKRKKPALLMCGLLSVLYTYVFILLQLETYALLAGSFGLFIVLALVMYFSKKIDWFNE